jgi:hypothetical protein
VQANIPIFGTGFGQGDVICNGCRPVIEVVCKGRLVYSTLELDSKPAFLDEKEHDVMSFTLGKQVCSDRSNRMCSLTTRMCSLTTRMCSFTLGTQGVTLLGDVVVTCYHVELKSDSDLPGLASDAYSEDSVDKKIIFRYCFHTGFVSPQPFRLHASDLDILPVGLLPMGASVRMNVI